MINKRARKESCVCAAVSLAGHTSRCSGRAGQQGTGDRGWSRAVKAWLQYVGQRVSSCRHKMLLLLCICCTHFQIWIQVSKVVSFHYSFASHTQTASSTCRSCLTLHCWVLWLVASPAKLGQNQWRIYHLQHNADTQFDNRNLQTSAWIQCSPLTSQSH